MIFFKTSAGRLGNKMFIYASAFAYAKESGLQFCIDEPVLFQSFNLGSFESTKNFLRLKYFWWIIHKLRFKGIIDMTSCNKIYTIDEFIDNTISTGYFQSPIYFDKYQKQVNQVFTVKDHYQKKYLEVSSKLNQIRPNMVIHVRRTDYLDHSPNNSKVVGCELPLTYYEKILSLHQIKNYSLIFISDDIDFCKKQFCHLDNAYFSENEAIIDLQFLANANICVISNSTFSWWGAWLNQKKDVKVYAPRYFLGFKDKIEYPVNILPKEWIQIDL
jgi:hypothetical protein